MVPYFRAGILNVSVALDLSDYLTAETDYVPWVTALGNLAYIGKLLEDKSSYENYSVSLLHCYNYGKR